MMLRLHLISAVAAVIMMAGPILAATQDEIQFSFTTDLCVSVIAIVGSLDYRYLHENNITDDDIFDNGQEFVCELITGLTVPIRGTEQQMQKMQSLLEDGTFVSSEMTVGIADDRIAVNGDDSVYLPSGDIIMVPRNQNDEDDGRKKQRRRARKMLHGGNSGGEGFYPNNAYDDNSNKNNRSRRNHRKLGSMYEGTKPILAVRATDSNGNVHPDSADTISDKIFGTYGDVANAKSQFEACSYGKTHVTNDYTTEGISQHLSAPGVIDVTIPISLDGNDRQTVRYELILAVQEKLGFQLPGPFQHVMFVLERCYTDCGWAAYAYVNSWLSIYQGDNYKFVSVQMHEIGHNLNLAHSGGLDGRTYTDHTCLMGNPHYSDEEGVMCYNPAKNFQIAREGDSWYNENDYDTHVWNSGTIGGTTWSGSIIGIADYKNNPNTRPVVVKLESGGPDDLFVGFNRAAGINRDTADARDQVTVIESGNDGLGYSQSFLKAILSQGESYRVENWRDSGFDMTIHVKEINLSANPTYADIIMTFGDPQANPTKNPTWVPTRSPSSLPTQSPTKNPTHEPCGNSICDIDENSTTCPADCLDKELETTFEYNLGSGGNMFTIEAERDIVIYSFAINSNSRGEGAVKVYTRPGGYADNVYSSVGWDLVYNKRNVIHSRRGYPTELGEFLGGGITVAGGTSQSFFVASTKGLVYRSGVQENSAFESDESLTVLEGIGTDATFTGTVYSPRVWGGVVRYNVIDITLAPTVSPTTSIAPTIPIDVTETTCGDSVCHMSEDALSCPVDCAGKGLETTFDFSLGSSGNMFTVRALRDISVSSLVINAMSRGIGAVQVYTRSGSYIGHEQSDTGWDLIYDKSSVKHNRRGSPTELGDFDNVVSIARGATQSFFVTSTKRVVYQQGTEEGAPFVSDESMVIYEGAGTTDIFAGLPYTPRVFGGIIRYDAHVTKPGSCGDSKCDVDENSNSCPVDCAGKELETTFDFDRGSDGNMFAVQALRDISVSSFVINAMSRGEGAVQVYTRSGSYVGHEQSSAGWEIIYDNSTVSHNQRGLPTELDIFGDAIPIASGATQSFFVTSTKKLVYQIGTEEGAQFVSDESMVIYEGVGTTGSFAGEPFSPRVFGGIIRYDVR